MAIRDRIEVVYDEGGRAPEKVVLEARSAGGSVDWAREGGFVRVREVGQTGTIRRELAVREERVISLTVIPDSGAGKR